MLEAIDADDPAMLREELGDVLMQVAFHAVIEEERGRFTFEDVCPRCARSWCSGTRTSLPLRRRRMPV